MKHIILLIALFIGCTALVGCTDELYDGTWTPKSEANIVGEFVETTLSLPISNLSVSATRAEEPLDENEEDTNAERYIEGIWVFQFDAENLTLVNGTPKYQEVNSEDYEESMKDCLNIDTGLLTTNDGKASIVYVVANVGSDDWLTTTTSFTLDDLEKTTIPNPEPIYTNEYGNPESSIPMSGQTESSVIVNDRSRITVPVYRMFAKLEVTVTVDTGDQDIEASKETLDIGAVPNTCTVGTLFTTDDAVPDYPTDTKFLPWTFDMTDHQDDDYTYVIYVPENIQGETSNTEEGKKSVDAPANATMVTTHLNVIDTESATIKADPQYTVYPGGNVINNFNIRRNCVYRVNVTILPSDVISPCANCLVATPGELFAFYPYVRDETGHRDDGTGGETFSSYAYYDIENHLNPDVTSLAIAKVKIIWQSPSSTIGNNSDGSRVYLKGSGKNTKIYVKAGTAGNALIAAYNAAGTIIWSWHIWITTTAPDNVNNAIIYTHYTWSSSGINTNERENGYPVMRCNLGALANTPGSDYTQTYGMLYQWGRKDPFPPLKTNDKYSGIYKYCDYTTSSPKVNVTINVWDNDSVKINLGTNTGLPGSGTGYDVFNTILTTGITDQSQAGGIQYSIENPTMFIAGAKGSFGNDSETNTEYYDNMDYYLNYGDWLPGSDDDLWGGNSTPTKSYEAYKISSTDSSTFEATLEDNFGDYKTIFDPCPYGWRVSPGNIWLGFTADGLNFSYTSTQANGKMDQLLQAQVNCVDTATATIASQMGFTMYMKGWKSGDTAFFPTQGSRLANGQPFHGGICGNYHNATVDELVDVWGRDKNDKAVYTEQAIKRVDILHFHNAGSNSYTQVNPFEKEIIYYNRAVAGPVRCVRDTQR